MYTNIHRTVHMSLSRFHLSSQINFTLFYCDYREAVSLINAALNSDNYVFINFQCVSFVNECACVLIRYLFFLFQIGEFFAFYSILMQDVFLMIRRKKTTIFTDAKDNTTVGELKKMIEGKRICLLWSKMCKIC